MLIEFSVSNFRSFRERQTLSMVAAPRLRRRENTFKPDLLNSTFPALLKVAAIYGANASGKSNLVSAIRAVIAIASLQPQATPEKLPVDPFRFDPSLASLPSRFEVHFIAAQQRYEFELHVTKDRVEFESLVAFPNGKETPLYRRIYANGRDEYEYGAQLEGGKEVHETWSKLTSASRLFLSQAVANSNAELNQLRPPLQWLTGEGLNTITGVALASLARHSHMFLRGQPSIAKDMASFIRTLDIPVTRMKFELLPTEVSDPAKSDQIDITLQKSAGPNIKATFTHHTALGEATFDFDDESTGTQNLVGFFLPWMILTTKNPNRWKALVVDELDTSLHPNIVAELIRQHQRNQTNSQLIFTTHDTHLMDTRLLRRDQIWLTERDKNGATQLHSIHDFEGRESEDLEKRYYEGRYRGLPILTSE